MGWRELSIDIPGLRLAARAFGPEDGAPVLCLHGWLDNAASFATVVPALAQRLPQHRFVALDLPGHGHSAHRGEGFGYAFIDAVADVAAACDARAWSRVAVIGHSLGAALALALAGAQPERVSSLVLVEGLGPLTDAPEQAAATLGRALAEAREKRGRRAPVYATRDGAIERLVAGVMGLSREAAAVLCERGLIEVEGGVTWRADPRLRWQSRLRLVEAQVESLLRAITAPTLFVRGASGFFPDGERVDRRAALVSGLRMVTLPGRHHLHLEHPEPVAAAIAEHLGGA
ncbi:MAG: alpha/beta hydrolase [Deltaproteobacteria bacterium]|nr:alpha/beta hydrolase [Deltaproteobacteria bacterium]